MTNSKGVPRMKIENGYNKYLQNVQQNNQKSVSRKENKQVESKVDKNVEVNISDEAKKLSEVSQQEIYSERVQDIKAAIKNGTYEVKPKEISESIMRIIQAQEGNEE